MICRNTAIHLIPHSVRKRDAKQAPCHHHHWGRSKHIVAKGNVLLSGVAGVEYCLNTPLNVIFMVLQMWHEECFNDNQPDLKLLGSILVIIMKEDVLLQEVDGRYVGVGSRNAIALGRNIILLVKTHNRKNGNSQHVPGPAQPFFLWNAKNDDDAQHTYILGW
jgi:hypothetical protein